MGHRERIDALDGLRGWAALMVVAYHLVWESFGAVAPGLRNPLFALLLNGPLAVAIFFILSGAALSVSYFGGGGERAVLVTAAKRYTRLTIPILASSLLVWLLMREGFIATRQAAPILGRQDWMGSFLTDVPASFAYVLKWSLAGVYGMPDARHAVNPFLWTMHYEAWGSILVFAVLLLFRRAGQPFRLLIVGAALVALLPERGNHYSSFLCGIVIAAAWRDGVFAQWQAWRFSGPVSLTVLLLVAGLGNTAVLSGIPYGDHVGIVALPVMLALFANRRAVAFLSGPLSRFLGRISFPLFLIQFPVVAGFTAPLVVRAAQDGTLGSGEIGVIIGLSLALALAASVLFLPVEWFTREVGRHIARLVPRGNPAQDKTRALEPAPTV
jgi:peptidoglycan/LPS O-acetylase OafA/YrhL